MPYQHTVLTYTDEDGDIVMLDDDDDLRDAALRQKLNPLRITVQLKKNQPTEKKILLHQLNPLLRIHYPR